VVLPNQDPDQADHLVGVGPFLGEYFPFREGYFALRPSAGLKILIGGAAPAALRRVAA
jgi:hypothetical protein